MNCKPGDLAIMIADKRHAGRLVEVLYASPRSPHQLPDGFQASGALPGYWVCLSLGSPFDAPIYCIATGERTWRAAMYASLPDWALRPLRGDEAGEGTSESLTHSASDAPQFAHNLGSGCSVCDEAL